jgi:phosphatidylglycerol:prolipoprotein diacylglycerol transferase
MSFHGGLLGVITAILAFSFRNAISPFLLSDLVALVTPIGLFFGRIANFINGELWGRPSDVPWAMIFPRGGPMPRHPSQLYQATFEGILLFSLLLAVWKFTDGRKRPGLITGVFCMGYAVARIVGEIFREPDSFLGFILGSDWLTMGMLLSLPVLAFGGWLVWRAYRNPLVTTWPTSSAG